MEYNRNQGNISAEAGRTLQNVLQSNDRIAAFLQLFRKVAEILPSAIVREKDGRLIGASCPGERFIFYISRKESDLTIKFQSLPGQPFDPAKLPEYLDLAEEQAQDRLENPADYKITERDKPTKAGKKRASPEQTAIKKAVLIALDEAAQALLAWTGMDRSESVPVAACDAFLKKAKAIASSMLDCSETFRLQKEDREIYRQRLTTEKTLEEIAVENGNTKDRVSGICSKAKKALVKEIKGKPSPDMLKKVTELSTLITDSDPTAIFTYLRYLILQNNYLLYIFIMDLLFDLAHQQPVKDAVNNAPRPSRKKALRGGQTVPLIEADDFSDEDDFPSGTVVADATNKIAFFDLEVGTETKKLLDIGAVIIDRHNKYLNRELRTTSRIALRDFVACCRFVCGHNIFAHDLRFVRDDILSNGTDHIFIDTLPMSPLLFPAKPYHRLVKDDKLQAGEMNNPLNDAKQAAKVFYDELNAFYELPGYLPEIYCDLLSEKEEFRGFFSYVEKTPSGNVVARIRNQFAGRICDHADLETLVSEYPVELAYSLAIINTGDRYSIIPAWVSHNYPDVPLVMEFLRNIPCKEGCDYCREHLDIHKNLKRLFDFDGFRTYNGEPLQEQATQAAVNGSSLLAIFPTGGGKSLAFQLPALMAGETVRGLTVVISPLQSLMKDQVDNLGKQGISDAVTINGLLNPLERSDAVRQVENGSASILYISPESLRSASVEKLLLSRNVVRFVIDEAHCFSAWGQDFRPDYLYIGDFIRSLQEKKHLSSPIPVSCFTATAKQKVISDIKDYFRQKLNLELQLYTTDAMRSNLRYEVIYRESEEEKYTTLRDLIRAKECATIVYVNSRRKARDLAERLTKDGLKALPYHGKMDSNEKIENQNAFMVGAPEGVNIIVATSAFGMGVDKGNVGLVIHFNISGSLEDYVQEAGRAGRDPKFDPNDPNRKAECYVLFNDRDIDEQFVRLTQQKLSIKEIKDVWKAVKDLSGKRGHFTRSALEIARQAGWKEIDDTEEIETRVKVALAALENAGYIRRGRNVPRVYADGILSRNMKEAVDSINKSGLFNEKEKKQAGEIIRTLISRKHRSKNPEISDEADNRVDVIADRLEMSYFEISRILDKLSKAKVLADSQDMSAFVEQSDTELRSQNILKKYSRLERFLIENLKETDYTSYKELNDAAQRAGVKTANVRDLKRLLAYWQGVGLIKKKTVASGSQFVYTREFDPASIQAALDRKLDIAAYIIEYLFSKIDNEKHRTEVLFSTLELTDAYNGNANLFTMAKKATMGEVRAALLYLNKIGAIELDGGFLVFFNAMQVERVDPDKNVNYKKADYEQLRTFYEQKIQQVHIVRKYAQLMKNAQSMAADYEAAQAFVYDYFQMDYMGFLRKYFRGVDISRPITAETYNGLFGELTDKQREIIDDDASQYIVVAAGPGSGKTKLLVHKLASLRLLEDVKSEQLLMLTFSRSAATEFKERLLDLMGPPGYYIEVKTFHSYCFDLLGQLGTLEESKDVVRRATDMIKNGAVDLSRITRSVLVIDEAQDMSGESFALVQALMKRNEDMRVIAVGDDDQAIFDFAGSSSEYMLSLIREYGAKKYELTDNFRSSRDVVAMANCFVSSLKHRLKSQPIEAVKHEQGLCCITTYDTPNMETATLEFIKKTYHGGSCCVLTARNESAFLMCGLLKRAGFQARLIQANDNFDLYNLAELRAFVEILDSICDTPVIPNTCWDKGLEEFRKRFRESTCLEDCLDLLDRFDKINPTKYRTDLLEYIHESKYEDLSADPRGCIMVSTFHKSKGREFDYVYLILDQPFMNSEEKKRVLYVGMTRAKKYLYIGCNDSQLGGLRLPSTVQRFSDHKNYPEANEIIYQLSHHGVNLGFFELRKDAVRKLTSGAELFLEGEYLSYGDRKQKVVRLSKAANAEVSGKLANGYSFKRAEVRNLVYWRPAGEPDAQEELIVLPTIELIKGEPAAE